jgi:hypothetical protein
MPVHRRRATMSKSWERDERGERLRAAYEEALSQLFPADERCGNYVDDGPRVHEFREAVRAYVRYREGDEDVEDLTGRS